MDKRRWDAKLECIHGVPLPVTLDGGLLPLEPVDEVSIIDSTEALRITERRSQERMYCRASGFSLAHH